MKKLLFFLAACAVSLSTFAATITAPDVDFGTVSGKGVTELEGSEEVVVTFSGLANYSSLYAEVTAGDGEFYLSEDYVYYGDKTSATFTINYYVGNTAATYTGKVRFYGWDDGGIEYEKVINLKLVVTDEAIVEQVTPYVRVNSTSDLAVGDEIIFVNESKPAVSGALNGAYLQEVTENVTVNATTGEALVPLNAQSFIVGKYNSNWNFTATGTSNYLLLIIDSSDKNYKGLALGSAVAGKKVSGWSISISNGEAEITYPQDDYYQIWFNNNRFKSYYNGAYSPIAIYKKSGDAQDVEAKLEISPSSISLGDVACSATKSVEISYTAEHLEDDITWSIIGTDKNDFEFTLGSSNSRTSGTVTITYKGTSSKSGALSAALRYDTKDAKKDPMYNSFVIGINLIQLNSIAFKQTTYNVLKGEELNLGSEVTFNPSTVSEKGLTWSFKNSEYFATITDAGVFKATTTGDRIVIAKSVLDENIQATCTVKVSLPEATEVQLDKTTLTLHKEEYYDLTATIKPDGTEKSVKYSNDNTTAVKVQKQSNGKFRITGLDFGTGTETANVKFYVDGKEDIYTICVVTVERVAVESITFDESSVSVNKGSTLDLTTIMHINPEPGAGRDNPASYETSDLDVAQVDGDGLLTALDEGTATITVSAGGKTGTITVVVGAPKMFSKVYDPSQLANLDTIVLASLTGPVMAGEFVSASNKMTPLTENITVTNTEAFADDAIRIVLEATSTANQYKIKIAGTTTYFGNASKAEIKKATKAADNWFWDAVADGTNGVIIKNSTNTTRYIGRDGNFVRAYSDKTKLYVYVRKYHDPATAVENIEAEQVPAQKMLHEGRIVILRDGVMYEIDGRRTK